MKRNAFPLDWPTGVPRTPTYKRKASKFRNLSLAGTRDDLLAEIRRMDGGSIVLSTNIHLRRDGLLYASGPAPQDPGVAVYFRRHPHCHPPAWPPQKDYAIACDQYKTVAENMRALQATLAAIRTVERHGSAGLFEQALSAFTALPASDEPAEDPSWWSILGFAARPTRQEAHARWLSLAAKHHPDKPSGSREAFELYRRAWETGESEFEHQRSPRRD